MAMSLSRSTSPSFSGIVGGKSRAERGRKSRPSRPDSRSIRRIASRRWDMGRSPSTSPVKTKAASTSSMRSLALENINMRQSRQGFIPLP